MRAERWERPLLLGGAIAAAAALALTLIAPGPALTGWLAAATAFAGVPTGGLVLMMMMRLIPGAWGEGLRLSTEAASLLALPAALGFVPVLIGMGPIYPWLHGPLHSAFQRSWLAPIPFALRTILFFALLVWLGRRMRQRRRTTATASAGLIAVTLLGSAVGVDWLMSLEPEFASSVFGLQVLLFQIVVAFAGLLLLRLGTGRAPPRLGVIGALFLTLLLLWAYFDFLPFFIAWSGNLPPTVSWYAARAQAGWPAATWAFAILGGVPLFALLFSRIRRSRHWLILLAGGVLLGRLIEFAWLALPGRGSIAIAACCLAMTGFTAMSSAGLTIALRARIRARTPRVAR